MLFFIGASRLMSCFLGTGPLAANDHMVKNPKCWRASYALGHPKQSDFIKSNLSFGCPRAWILYHVNVAAKAHKYAMYDCQSHGGEMNVNNPPCNSGYLFYLQPFNFLRNFCFILFRL